MQPSDVIIQRIAVTTETVTLRHASDLSGCDNTRGPREGNRHWCGTSSGRVDGGHLSDPRLDIVGCRTSQGELVGFAWIEPGAGVRYVVVDQPGYAEVFEVAGGLPIRVPTIDVQVEGSRASFRISEYHATGMLVRRYTLEAVPAG
jgi:hypothetical protein